MGKKVDEDIVELMLNLAKETLNIDDKYQNNAEKTLIMIGGQPGSGKSSLINAIKNKFDGDVVVLNSDDVKAFHPEYENMLRDNPDKADEQVQDYSNHVIKLLKKHLVANGYNVLVEGTLRNSDTPLKAAQEFKDSGYKVEVHILSVNEHESWIRCINRYEMDVDKNGYGRSVTKDYHDNAYKNIPTTLKDVINSNHFDNIIIYDREGKEIENIQNKSQIITKYMHSRENINDNVMAQCTKLIKNIESLKLERDITPSELNELEMIRKELEKDYQIYKSIHKSIVITNSTSNEDVLKYFEQYDKNNNIDKWRETGKIKTESDFHYLDNENPERVATILNQAFNTNVQIESVKSQNHTLETTENNIEIE
jgi:UDP-N-acetylglucosamine kinase